MTWLFNFFQSSIGKKVLIATTGVVLSLFLIIHLIGNLMLFGGEEVFNTYVSTLSGIKPLVRIIEVILFLVFLGHILSGFYLALENKKATPVSYKVSSYNNTASIQSRSMAISGSILFIFLLFHLQTFWCAFQKTHGVNANYYEIVMDSLIGYNNPLVAGFYVVALILLALHLRHGFESAFQTFGLSDSRYKGIVKNIAVLFWFVIPAAFISIPVYFGFIK